MSPAPIELTLSEPSIVIVPWYDDVVDPIGYDPRSAYVEMFWLNVLGPTATWLLRRMVTGLDEYPGGYELELDQTASALGLTFTPGASNPFARSLNRCVLFGAAQPIAGGLAVRRRLPPVANRHLQRMPPYLRTAHQAWREQASSSADEVCRARTLTEAMLRVGDPPDAIERQLLGLGVPPRIALDVSAAATRGVRSDFAPDAA
jgi:hypothetical protein